MDTFDTWMTTVALPFVALTLEEKSVQATIRWMAHRNPAYRAMGPQQAVLRNHLPNGMWQTAYAPNSTIPHERTPWMALPSAHRTLAIGQLLPAFFAGFEAQMDRLFAALPPVRMVYDVRFTRDADTNILTPTLDVGWSDEFVHLQRLPFSCHAQWPAAIALITDTFYEQGLVAQDTLL